MGAPTKPCPHDTEGTHATVTSATQISLSWDPSTDNVGMTGYRVFRCTDAACVTTTMVAAVARTTFAGAGLAPGTTYGYRVRAADAAENLSEPSRPGEGDNHRGPVQLQPILRGSLTLTIVRGSSGSTTVTRTLVAGTAEPVALSISGVPSGAAAILTNNACMPTYTSTLNVATTVSTPVGAYSLILTGGTPLS